MTTDETYNGWTNRETWAFMLYVTNDEGLAEMARECVVTATDYANARPEDSLQSWAESLFTRAGYAAEFGDKWPSALADIASDIGSLWRINWSECVAALAEDAS